MKTPHMERAVEFIRGICLDDSYSRENVEEIVLSLATALQAVEDETRERCIGEFIQKVERRAEANMLKTGKLEGAHYAAMKAEYTAIRNQKGE